MSFYLRYQQRVLQWQSKNLPLKPVVLKPHQLWSWTLTSGQGEEAVQVMA